MQLNKNSIENILIGASVLGTGGGGRFDLAKKILQGIYSPITIVPMSKVRNNDLIITTFMVGGLKKKGDLGLGAKKSIDILKDLLKKNIAYLIPVEIGPTAVMNVLKVASLMKLPVIDGDLVGFRSAPEIYVEAITLNNVNRLPIVAVNLEGDTIILKETESIEKIETILRTFSAQSKTEVYVAGYPMYKSQIEGFFGNGSITISLEIGKALAKKTPEEDMLDKLREKGLILIDFGTVTTQSDKDINGFTQGKMKIRTYKNVYEVLYKNEYLVLLKTGKVILTSPDSIILVDYNTRTGLNNSENNKNKQVYIFAKKALPIWRKAEGKKLFAPKRLGLDYEQKLLV